MIYLDTNEVLPNAIFCQLASSQYISLPAIVFNPAVTTTYSVSGWFYCSNFNGAVLTLLSNRNPGTTYGGIILFYNKSTNSFNVNITSLNNQGSLNVEFLYSAPSILINRWVHFVFTKSTAVTASGINFYVNGIQLNRTIIFVNSLTTGAYIIPNNPVWINASDYGSPTNINDCYFSNYSFFSRVLTSTEVLALYKFPKLIPSTLTSNLGVNYPFTNYNGTTLTETVSGFNGTLIGYTSVNTATSPNPQSGNTTWYNTVTMQPITI